MKRFRRRYYDLFSHLYDKIIALHSQDKRALLRELLVEKTGLKPGGSLIDLCTGTGAVAITASKVAGKEGLVIGVDFSLGMLKKAHQKAKTIKATNLYFVLADVARLPFADKSFDAVTCSHAMYELDPLTREAALKEAYRVLKPGGCFAMMEHCEPKHPFIRLLYYIRLASMGSTENRAFARDERPFLARYFEDVKLEVTPTGGSKIIRGIKK
ncbi:class I SAM-dependent methyltransferase [Thermodesulfatator indicus]